MKMNRRFLWSVLALLVAVGAGVGVYSSGSPPGIDRPLFEQPDRVAAKSALIDADGSFDLVFIGDSITQNFDKTAYQPVWQKFYGARHALNLGYGGDTTGAALWRIARGELDGLSPRVTVILLGTNDTNLKRTPAQTVSGVLSVVDVVKTRLPQTRILLLGILPSDRSPEKTRDDRAVNLALAEKFNGDPRVTFFDAGGGLAKDDHADYQFFVEQPAEGALHPNPAGQRLLAQAIEPELQRLFEE